MKQRIFSLGLAILFVVSMAVTVNADSSAQGVKSNVPSYKDGWYEADGNEIPKLNDAKSTRYPKIVYDTWNLSKSTKANYEIKVEVGETVILRYCSKVITGELNNGGMVSAQKLGNASSLILFPVNYGDGYVESKYITDTDKAIQECTYAIMKKDGKDYYMEYSFTGVKEGVYEFAYTLPPYSPQLFIINVVPSSK